MFSSILVDADARLVKFYSMQDIAYIGNCRAAITYSLIFRQFKAILWWLIVSFRVERSDVHFSRAHLALYKLSLSNYEALKVSDSQGSFSVISHSSIYQRRMTSDRRYWLRRKHRCRLGRFGHWNRPCKIAFFIQIGAWKNTNIK
jgi:hypothetical protein